MPHGQRQPNVNNATGPLGSQRLRLPSPGSPGNRTYRLRSSARRRCTQHLWGGGTARREGAVEHPNQALNILRYACARTASSPTEDCGQAQSPAIRPADVPAVHEQRAHLRECMQARTSAAGAGGPVHCSFCSSSRSSSWHRPGCRLSWRRWLRAGAEWDSWQGSSSMAHGARKYGGRPWACRRPAAACGGGAAHALQPHRHVRASCALSRSQR